MRNNVLFKYELGREINMYTILDFAFVVAVIGVIVGFIKRFVMCDEWGIPFAFLSLCLCVLATSSRTNVFQKEAIVTDKKVNTELAKNFNQKIKVGTYYLELDFDSCDEVSKSIYDEVEVGDTVNVEIKTTVFNWIMSTKIIGEDEQETDIEVEKLMEKLATFPMR